MAKTPKPTGKASKPDLKPLDEHLAALLNPALTPEHQAKANARAGKLSGRTEGFGEEGFGEAPQAGYSPIMASFTPARALRHSSPKDLIWVRLCSM